MKASADKLDMVREATNSNKVVIVDARYIKIQKPYMVSGIFWCCSRTNPDTCIAEVKPIENYE
jgi:hypothetical protein